MWSPYQPGSKAEEKTFPTWWCGMKRVSANERVPSTRWCGRIKWSGSGQWDRLHREFNFFFLTFSFEIQLRDIEAYICLFRDVLYEVKIKIFNKTELSHWWFLYDVCEDRNVFNFIKITTSTPTPPRPNANGTFF